MSEKLSILITGVGQRIGLHLAHCLIKQGFHVIGTYRTPRASINQLKALGAELYPVDFYQDCGVPNLVDKVTARHPYLRAVVHNASEWLDDTQASSSCESSVLNKMFNIHVRVPYELNLKLAPMLMQSPSEFADIIHFSDHVVSTGSPKHTAYAASKAAMDNLTLSFAARFAPKIKVNSIAPGLILFNENDSEKYKQKTLQKSLIQREGGLEEISETVNYLLNSRYVTGRTLSVDGGRHIAHKASHKYSPKAQTPCGDEHDTTSILGLH